MLKLYEGNLLFFNECKILHIKCHVIIFLSSVSADGCKKREEYEEERLCTELLNGDVCLLP